MISNLRKSIFYLQQAIREEKREGVDIKLLEILEKLAELVPNEKTS